MEYDIQMSSHISKNVFTAKLQFFLLQLSSLNFFYRSSATECSSISSLLTTYNHHAVEIVLDLPPDSTIENLISEYKTVRYK
jgi:hypothetical protein